MTHITRSPSVAGTFYPADGAELDRQVRSFLDQAPKQQIAAKAIIAPHAGYRYSGPIAGTAYAAVSHLTETVRRIVLIGPAHRLAFRGIAMPSATEFATPLGTVAVDSATLSDLAQRGQAHVLDHAFDGEHDLEVHLPFIQRVFPQAKIVPLLVGEASPEAVEQVLKTTWGGSETLIIISSDLSHYQEYDVARKIDLATSQAIEAGSIERLGGQFACGHLPIAGLLRRAAHLDLRCTTIDLRNSGDTSGDHSRVVGYGAYVFEYSQNARLSDDHRRTLHHVAQTTLRHAAATGRQVEVDMETAPFPLRAMRKTFITLDASDGNLRGCIGSTAPVNPLAQDVAINTYRSARQDPRFGPVKPSEVDHLKVTISILSTPSPMTFVDESDLIHQLHPEVDGLILREGSRQSLFLPKVWSVLPNPTSFVQHLKQKAGLPADYWSKTMQAFRFVTETF
ncbi:MEMO1 family protein [Azospirillaceae bacterium]